MGIPNYPQDLSSEWQQIKRDVKNAYTSANLRTGMAKIGARVIEITGELIMNAGAKLVAKYDNGNSAFSIQSTPFNGSMVQQVRINRYNGSNVFQVFGSATEPGFWSLSDPQGNVIISDDAGSGQGLARPYIPYTAVRTAEIGLPPDLNTTSTYAAHVTICGEMQHPRIKVRCYVYATGGDLAQIRLRDADSGTVVYTSATNLSGWHDFTANHADYDFGRDFRYDLDVRRTAGASFGAGIAVLHVEGVQS